MTPESDLPTRPVFVPPGGPPSAAPSGEIFSRMGRENLLLLCSDFYRRLETTPLRPMFPEDMQEASRHLAWFLIQITGGPPLFSELRGPPMMRRRHLPFRIDAEARRIWLETFLATLGDGARYNFPEEHLPGFVRFLTEFSAWMVNTA